MMTEFDDLIARLRGLGSRPVDPTVASEHLTAMAAVTRSAGARSRLGRAKIVAAFAAGLVLGGTSLASAGVMGETVQNSVADAAAKVNVNLPGGTPRSTDGCGAITAKNHGDFVRQGGDPKANCGKPQKAVDNKQNAGPENEANASSACKPPWAGKGLTKEQRAAARQNADAWRTANAAQCPADAGEVESEADEDEGNENENNGKKPESTATVTPQGNEVVPPEGGQDDNAGVPSDGDTPADDDQGEENRPDDAPATTLPDPAAENRATSPTVTPEG